ncbi:MAG: hypothetical protein DMG39_14590 [Acidobacteria bacterium]|nr:MAG: hypothetical protein DMG39_14590 [Acidobacteriota bacterium]
MLAENALVRSLSTSHGSILGMHDGNNNFRERASKHDQVSRIGWHVAHDERCLFSNGRAGESRRGGKRSIGWRARSAIGNDLDGLIADVVHAPRAAMAEAAHRLGELFRPAGPETRFPRQSTECA